MDGSGSENNVQCGGSNLKVYLAILEDRHIDDDIRVFESYDAARMRIDLWKAGYPHVTEYEEDAIQFDVWQADEEQEEGLIMSIQEKEVL